MSEAKEPKTPEVPIEKLYLQEKKKSQILLISTVGLAILFCGSLLYNPLSLNQTKEPRMGSFDPGDQFKPQDGNSRMGARSQQTLTQYFNADKALNKEAVDKFLTNLPADFKANLVERFPQRIDSAVVAGQVTREQGDELLKYIKSKTDEGSN